MHEDLIRARLDRNTQYKPGKALKIFYTSSNEYNFQIGVQLFDRLNDRGKTSCVVFSAAYNLSDFYLIIGEKKLSR